MFAVTQNKKRTHPFVKFLAWVLGSFLTLGMIIGMVTQQLHPPTSQVNKVSDARLQFAAGGALMLRKSMRNPDSFKLTSADIIDATGTVCYEYRAQNGFGGMNVGQAVLTPKGAFKTDDMNGFDSLWNHECAHKRARHHVRCVQPS